MRTIGVVTTSRADYSYLLPVMQAIANDSDLYLQLFVSGMHLVPEFGMSVKEIEAGGLPVAARVESLLASDSAEGVAKSMAIGLMGFAQVFSSLKSDILIVLGDRFEMHAAAAAALPFKLPVAHIGGGDVTEGAMDESLRHSMTKLSHLHFVATEEQADRVRQLGEEPWRITITGEPSLDLICTTPKLAADEMFARFGVQINRPFLLANYHPVTLEYEETPRQIEQFLAALNEVAMPVIFTAPNADTGGSAITAAINRYIEAHPDSKLVRSFGPAGYFTVMAAAAAMVGNSSSGIIEAASFNLPVVNVGTRQLGRLRGPNVIDCGYASAEVVEAIRRAVSARFRASIAELTNPYGDGNASTRIVHRLKTVSLDQRLIQKRFWDRPGYVQSHANRQNPAGR